MASGLSSNWKRLQAQLQQGSSDNAQGRKRKAQDKEEEDTSHKPPPKKTKTAANPRPLATPKNSAAKKPTAQGKSLLPKRSSSNMGAVQSQPSEHTTLSSSALWAPQETNGSSSSKTTTLSAEEISEAYNLGIKYASMLQAEPARPNEGLAPPLLHKQLVLGKHIAIDCEMVGVGEGGTAHALARVSIVDFHGRQVYDSYVRPRVPVTNWRTAISGIEPRHMATARDLDEVRATVAELLHERILVGHDVKHDLRVLMLEHPSVAIRDTAKHLPFKKYGNGPKPALRVLARELLGVEIQTGQHSSLEDARATMLLYRNHKPAMDLRFARKPLGSVPESPQTKIKTKQKKTKKKRRN